MKILTLGAVMLIGGGAFSLDALIGKYFKRDSEKGGRCIRC